jgi:hypothetical protein
MEPIQFLAWTIVFLICFVLAPFMTIGIIFLNVGWNILGTVFLILGIIHLLAKLFKN